MLRRNHLHSASVGFVASALGLMLLHLLLA